MTATSDERPSCQHWARVAWEVNRQGRGCGDGAGICGVLTAQAQSGAALPAGFFHVVKNQIVSDAGVNALLSCIGYDEPTGRWSSDMSKIRSAGFGCVRYSWWRDAVTCLNGRCNFRTLDELTCG